MTAPETQAPPRPAPVLARAADDDRPTAGRRRATLGILVAATAALAAAPIARCGNGLSPIADGYSEANVVRAGERFALSGYAETFGLPDVGFGDRFPDDGITGASGSIPGDTVYHGYPPGSEWLGGLYTMAFGPADLWKFRLVPTAMAVLAASVFASVLIGEFGAARGGFAYACCLAAPMFTNMAHGLYFHGYALSLLLVEVALTILICRRPGAGPGLIAPFALLGFAQGWLSFDYCFLTAFAPAPIALLATPTGRAVRWRAVAAAVVLAGSGFVLAHALHFAQSAFYFGGIGGALEEFSFRSNKQYGLTGYSTLGIYGWTLGYYPEVLFRWTHLFTPASLVVVPATAATFLIRRAAVVPRIGPGAEVESSPARRYAWAILAATAIGLMWLLAKPNHAANHVAYTARHFFLAYLSCCLTIALSAGVRPLSGDGR